MAASLSTIPINEEDAELLHYEMSTTREQHQQEPCQNNHLLMPLNTTNGRNGTSCVKAKGLIMDESEGREEENSILDDSTLSAGDKTPPKSDGLSAHNKTFEREEYLEKSCCSPQHHNLDNEISSNARNSPGLMMVDRKQPKGKERYYSSITELTEELEDAIDSLFLSVNHNEVTVKEFHNHLENELGHSMPKNLKALVKQRLLRLLRGEIGSFVGKGDKPTVSDCKSASSEEYDDVDKVKRKLETRNSRTERQVRHEESTKNKEITSKRLPKKGETSKKKFMEQRFKTVRQKKIEDEKVRNEELSGAAETKIHDEDLRRQEAIAARFETGQEEAIALREKNRRCLLKQLLMKKYTVLAIGQDDVRPESLVKDENYDLSAMKENTHSQDLDDASTASSSSRESDNSSEGELEVILPSRSSFIDNILNPSSFTGTSNCIVANCFPNQTKCFTVSREVLRKSLKCRAIHAGNTWLARELGYKTQEEHLKDCSIAESRRKYILRKQEEKKQILLSGSLIKDEEYLTEFSSSDNEEASEDDEERQLAHEVMREKREETGLAIKSQVNDEIVTEDVTQMIGSQLVYDNVLGDDSQSIHQHVMPGSQLIDDDPVDNDSKQESYHAESRFSGFDSMKETRVPTITESIQDDMARQICGKNVVGEDINSLATIATTQTTGDPECELNPSYPDPNKAAEDSGGTDIDSVLNQRLLRDKKDRAEGWKAVLQREAKTIRKKKKMYKASISALIEEEAEEEEEDVAVVGLEDFGFGVRSKKTVDDEEELASEEGDLDGIVDELSDDEGDEEEGARARKMLQEREEKQLHKDLLRRMRDGYDGRRGGIASGGARGVHRFEELVAADDRNEARRLGLLNDDELDSDEEFSGNSVDHEEDDDEAVLIDKMLKDRFLHRTDEERLFSDSGTEEENEELDENETQSVAEENFDVMERLMEKRFEKNARRNLVFDIYGDSLLGSESRIIDEDESLKKDLRCIQTSSKKRRIENTEESSNNLPIAIMTNNRRKKKASFRSGKSPDAKRIAPNVSKSVTLSHVVFQSSESHHGAQLDNSWSQSCFMGTSTKLASKSISLSSESEKSASSLWSRVSSNAFRKHKSYVS